MDERTAAALEASIKHWQENVAAETPLSTSTDGDDCALCAEFNREIFVDCNGCPVRGKTGYRFCVGTPYHKANSARDEWLDADNKSALSVWRAAAQAELDFLISLRESPVK
jgi:hypothetical protein